MLTDWNVELSSSGLMIVIKPPYAMSKKVGDYKFKVKITGEGGG